MNLKYIDNLHNASDKALIESIKGIQRRLDKNIDDKETQSYMAERQEVYIGELEKRGLSYE